MATRTRPTGGSRRPPKGIDPGTQEARLRLRDLNLYHNRPMVEGMDISTDLDTARLVIADQAIELRKLRDRLWAEEQAARGFRRDVRALVSLVRQHERELFPSDPQDGEKLVRELARELYKTCVAKGFDPYFTAEKVALRLAPDQDEDTGPGEQQE